jgi:glycosyltransferase involved in cell wall biosynthesis
MNVLLLFSTSNIGGTERSITRMALASSSVNYKLSSFSSQGEWSEWVSTLGGNPITFGSERSFFFTLLNLYKYIRSNHFDVVYVFGGKLSLILQLLHWILPNVKLVHGMRHNPDSNSRQDRALLFGMKWLQGSADGWITNSLCAKETLVKKSNIPEDRITVIYNGIDIPKQKLVPLIKRPMEVITVANMRLSKGYLEYLDVIRRVVSVLPEVKFVFIGRDDMSGVIEQAIINAGLQSFIRYTGFQKDVSKSYNRARVFVLPSLWGEGCPTTILEAFSFGVPVVAYAIDGIPEIVNNNTDGILIKPKDVQSMTDSICKLLTNTDVSQEYANSGYKKVSDSFSLKSSALNHDTYWLDF